MGTATVRRRRAGWVEGRPVDAFTISNATGMTVQILEFGAVIQSVVVPDVHDNCGNVALGHRDLHGYVNGADYLGAVVGRFANRIENGRFSIDGRSYQVTVNEPPNCVHGGYRGLHKRIWAGAECESGVRLRYLSPSGEEGFPGALNISITYAMSPDENTLRLTYEASADAPTIVNLTNHSYFNLEGEGRGTVLDHTAVIEADHYLPLTRDLLPTGERRSVAGTPMDFRLPRRIGASIGEVEHQDLTGGYDHNFVLRPHDGPDPRLAVTLTAPISRRSLQVWTTEPAVDFYTGNYLDGSSGYQKWAAVAIEPEHVSNSPNLRSFPSTVLRPGERFRSCTEYRFSA